jgi:uncharacterized protein (TIGR02246 family)
MTTDVPMSATATNSPQALMETFAAHVHARDLDALMGLYEADAVFMPEPGVVLTTTEEIRAALGAMLLLAPTMVVNPGQVLVAGDVALVENDWSMTGTAPDGTTVTQGGRSADVVRRGADGTWRVLIDRP